MRLSSQITVTLVVALLVRANTGIHEGLLLVVDPVEKG